MPKKERRTAKLVLYRQRLKRRRGRRCKYCGKKLPMKRLHVHHTRKGRAFHYAPKFQRVACDKCHARLSLSGYWNRGR